MKDYSRLQRNLLRCKGSVCNIGVLEGFGCHRLGRMFITAFAMEN